MIHSLRRLDAMRVAASQLMSRPHMGRDVFTRFRPWEAGEIRIDRRRTWRCSYFDLIESYSRHAARSELSLATTRESRGETMAKDDATKEVIRKLADHAERQADEAMTSALSWALRSGPNAAEPDLIKAGALYRARDVLREQLD